MLDRVKEALKEASGEQQSSVEAIIYYLGGDSIKGVSKSRFLLNS